MEEATRISFKREILAGIRGEVSFEKFTLGVYATDASIYQFMPLALVVPLDEEDVIHAINTARKYRIPVVPRGGGTSLGGQAVGPSMILDFSKYMNRILEINLKEKWVRVQPGIVLDELNAFLKRYRLHFAPDPATGNRATIGGMIGNNSSGSRSILYGITRDHVLETRVLLSDGTIHHFTRSPVETRLKELEKTDERGYQLLSGLHRIIENHREEIREAYPKIMRRVQGYNLDAYTDTDAWNLSDLITGSEGTLGLLLNAKLNLESLPEARILCVVHFASLSESIRAVAPILRHGPSAVEIMDEDLIRRALENPGIALDAGWIEGTPEGILIVEFSGDNENEVLAKANGLAADLRGKDTGYAWPVISDPEQQAKVWAVRKDGLGLMMRTQGDAKPIGFIEDAAVHLEHLPEYIDGILTFCTGLEVPVIMYAHASVGLIHVRPVLDLKEATDVGKMKSIARHSFELVKKFNGSISGEHGDGRTRSPFLEEFFGPRVYGALKEVKQLFDPDGIMNPGIIIDAGPMDENLRYGPEYRPSDIPTHYKFREEGSFVAAVETCSGVGVCRQNLGGLMCPSYRATRDEEHSTRGRANALRMAITGQMGMDGMSSRRLFEIMDLCLSCKGCKSECPSNVDVAKLKGEFLQHYREEHGTPLRDRFISRSTALAKRLAGWKAPLVNGIQKTMPFRLTMQWIAGIDRRRILPSYARKTFHNWFDNRTQTDGEFTRTVVLFDDTYMNYHETGVGISAVELLESCGYRVILAKAGCCQRPSISHGFLKKAKKEGEKTLRNLKRYIDEGLQVVVCEPGCASALTDDLPDLVEDEELAGMIRENVTMIDVFLEQEIKCGNLSPEFTSPFSKLLIHGHCHQKSLYGTTAMERVLSHVPGLEVRVIDSGCCGMAGSFGYEKEHYDLSMKVGEDRLFPAIREMDDETTLVACGFSCRHQIRDATGVQPKHWVETLRGG